MLFVRNLEKNGKSIPNQFIVEMYNDDNGKNHHVIFQSYNSTIINIDYDNSTITVYPEYNYSKTTIKHRNNFFKDIAMDYLASTKTLEDALKNGYIESEWIGKMTVKKFV